MSDNKKIFQQRICIVVLLVLLIVLLVLLLSQCSGAGEPASTAVIEENPQVQLTDSGKGAIRIKINPVVEIKDKTMQNLNFCNYNEDRLLRCRIKVGESYIYDSGYIAEGKILKGDYISTEGLQKGQNEATAEIYSYSVDETFLGQTNVKISLNLG